MEHVTGHLPYIQIASFRDPILQKSIFGKSYLKLELNFFYCISPDIIKILATLLNPISKKILYYFLSQ